MTADADLYRRWLAARDEAAFRALALRHADLVLDVAWRLSGDRARAEDAVQEALLALALDATDRPAAVGVRAWLARKAIGWGKNARASDAARARRESVVGDARGDARKEDDVREPDSGTADAVRAALDRLDGEDAAVLSLRYLHGLEYPELAGVLDLAEPTARVRVHRALAALRVAMGGRSEPDERLAVALGAVPAARFAPARAEAVVENVVSAARAAPLPGGPRAIGAPRPAAIVSAGAALRLGPIVLAGAVVAALGLGAFLLLQREEPAAPPSREFAKEDAPAGPGLRVPREAPRLAAMETAAPPTEEPAPGPPAPTPVDPRAAMEPAVPRVPLPPAVDARVHLALFGSGERLLIQVVSLSSVREVREVTPPVLDLVIGLRPGESLGVTTFDPRAGAWQVTTTVPDPVPREIEIRVPSREDPRLVRPVLRVVDAKTGSPLPRARLEPGRTAPGVAPLLADGDGRISVPPEVLRSLQSDASRMDLALVAEADHRPLHWDGRLKSAAEWAAWDGAGEFRVALEPSAEGEKPFRLRLLDVEGRPERDALLLFRAVWWTEHTSSFPARTDEQGRASSPTYRAFVVDVFVRGSFVASWILARDLSKEATPEGAVRDLRLPALATVRVEVTDGGTKPIEARVRLSKSEEVNVGAAEAAKKSGFDPGADYFAPGEAVPVPATQSHATTFEFLAPVGRDLDVSFHRADGKDWIRTWKVHPTSADAVFIRRAWSDLEKPSGR